MTRSIAILFLAILLPSGLLGWLALRGAEEQQIILERRTAELCQREVDSMAASARALVDERRAAFSHIVATLLEKAPADQLAAEFTTALAQHWPQPAVGFSLDRNSRLLCPTARDANGQPEYQKFLWNNGAFLGNKVLASVYPVPVDELKGGDMAMKRRTPQTEKVPPSIKKELHVPGSAGKIDPESSVLVMRDKQAMDNAGQQAYRNVAPQQSVAAQTLEASQVVSTEAGFQEVIAGKEEGILNRFVQDRLEMILWVRPPKANGYVFGCLIHVEDLRDLWAGALPMPDTQTSYRGSVAPPQQPEFIRALLDDKARPVALQPDAAHVPDWKRPFVATEIGEALPHWEAALYLAQPNQLRDSALSLRRTLSFLIVSAVSLIALGGWLVVADARRQMRLAQQKTDFVSNVSHELKTPLTSIRMFAELMQGGKAAPEKVPQYLRIITVEAERLTRLINNVLDFARMERKQKHYERRNLDLHAVLARLWEGQELHLREAGFTTRWDAAPPPYPIVGDEDALAQVLVNLLSNSEKYSSETKEVVLQSYIDGGDVCVSVLDRGVGVPAGEEQQIFKAFYRAHDSLASGVQGAGLGLTLAQRVVEEHGGTIRLQPRPGGGSNFTIRLPLREQERIS